MLTTSKILFDAIINVISKPDISTDDIIKKLDKARPLQTLSFTDLNIKGDLIINRGNKMIRNVVFYNCRFDNVKIIDSILSNVDFIHCAIANLSIDGADIEQCEFSNNEIDYITLKKAKMDSCTISNSKLTSICGSITMYKSTISDCYYDHIDLYNSVIRTAGIMIMRKYRHINHFGGTSMEVESNNSFLNCGIYNTLITSSYFSRSYFYKCDIEIQSTDSVYDESYSYETKLDVGTKCPEEGSFIGYKKVEITSDQLPDSVWSNEIIAVLEIPADAKRIGFGTNKCRCSKAKVLRFEDLKGDIIYGDVIARSYSYNYMDKSITYKVGEIVYPDSFDESKFNTCSNGIHFFMSKEDAINY